MAKVAKKVSNFKKLLYGIKWFFLKPPEAFSDKATLNKKRLGTIAVALVVVFVGVVLILPSNPQNVDNFSEKKDVPRDQVNTANGNKKFSSGVDTYPPTQNSYSRGEVSPPNRNTPMILARQGDISTQLPPGTKFTLVLADNATITSQNQPVIAFVEKDVVTDFGLAIPRETKVFGDASFDKEFRRANVQWKSVMYNDGRSKNISAIALASDNQPGIDGDVHSDATKNTIGSLITHFIAGAADGSISRGPLGETQGGLGNGLLNGASETAHERADLWTEDLKKERAWIDLKKGTRCQAILIDGFTYREPGGIN